MTFRTAKLADQSRVYVVDADAELAAALARLLRDNGHQALAFPGADAILSIYAPGLPTCVLADVTPGLQDGYSLARKIRAMDASASFVFMTASPSTAGAVDAIRNHGGIDYLEKPVDEAMLSSAIEEALRCSRGKHGSLVRIRRLTRRERQVFDLLVQGLTNKAIAARLHVSPKTVEDHRAAIMLKTEEESLAELIRIACAIAGGDRQALGR